jgi:diacylglycerol kinase family enzyme
MPAAVGRATVRGPGFPAAAPKERRILSATAPKHSAPKQNARESAPRRQPPADVTPGLSGWPPSARWYARLALLLSVATLVVILIGGLRSVAVLIVGLLGMALALVGAWEFLRRPGVGRWVGAGVAIAAPIAVLVLCITKHVFWQALVALALLIGAVWSARQAVTLATPPTRMPEAETLPPRRPFLVMNPRSGGGKVRRFSLDSKASGLGAEVALLDGPGPVDVAALARQAVQDGADLLGVAGGDGTQALVAGIAAEHHLPFLVISAGTRNHFAMDLGLDRERPDQGLDALTDGVEVILDLGDINGRTFVNNASFGAYAQIVQSPAYRDDKAGTTLQMLPDLLSGRRGPALSVYVDGTLVLDHPQAVLVSNNPYDMGDLAGLGRRARLDAGVLGVIAIRVQSAAQAAALLQGARAGALRQLTAHEIVIESEADSIPVGVDGEALTMKTPVHCSIRPGALRVRVPRTRLDIPRPRGAIDGMALVHQAFGVGPAASDQPK